MDIAGFLSLLFMHSCRSKYKVCGLLSFHLTRSGRLLLDPGHEGGDPGGDPRVVVTHVVLPTPAGQSN